MDCEIPLGQNWSDRQHLRKRKNQHLRWEVEMEGKVEQELDQRGEVMELSQREHCPHLGVLVLF